VDIKKGLERGSGVETAHCFEQSASAQPQTVRIGERAQLSWLNLVGISLGLAMDAFAVSIAAGLSIGSVTARHSFRLAFHFGLFQFMMPVIGWVLGRELVQYIADYDHWLAFGLLCLVGGKMLRDSLSSSNPKDKRDPTRGILLVVLSVATSIDALAVGLSLAFLRVEIWRPSLLIGIVAATLSVIGISLGNRLGPRLGRWAELTGGCILIFIGIRILFSHLWS
jgi:putative Mn2+ efflux pump MntP